MNIKKIPKVIIIDFGMGNLRSVKKILENFEVEVIVSNKKEELVNADKIILPGVGAFPDAMKNLHDLDLIETLEREVVQKRKPFLGICLGMQMLAKVGYEIKETKGLGWLDATVKPFKDTNLFRVPHIGWDHIKILNRTSLFKDFHGEPTFYFVHGFNLHSNSLTVVLATCEYGEVFTAAVQQHNIFGTQFHPEKSQANGMMLIDNFLMWKE